MRKIIGILAAFAICAVTMGAEGCDNTTKPMSASGVGRANIQVPVGPDGLTIEQRNVRDRVAMDNTPGSIKHLYIISAYSGQTLIYSTVRGKVTSSGKRLTPSTIDWTANQTPNGFPIEIGGATHYTREVLGDDGTYGSSVDYLYWFDAKGIYHQQYITGGMIVHISNEPVAVKGVVINMAQQEGAGAK